MKNMRSKLVGAVLLTTVGLSMTPRLAAAESAALMEPVKSVFVDYLKIQKVLAQDSTAGVADNAQAIVKLANADTMKMLPAEIAPQAGALAVAKDLQSARKAFQPLSNSLIGYLARMRVPPGEFFQVYCPMAKANWLQASKTVNNPYLGRSMATCGQVLPQFVVPDAKPGDMHGGHAGHAMSPGHQMEGH